MFLAFCCLAHRFMQRCNQAGIRRRYDLIMAVVHGIAVSSYNRRILKKSHIPAFVIVQQAIELLVWKIHTPSLDLGYESFFDSEKICNLFLSEAIEFPESPDLYCFFHAVKNFYDFLRNFFKKSIGIYDILLTFAQRKKGKQTKIRKFT